MGAVNDEWEGGRRQGSPWLALLAGAVVLAMAGGLWLSRSSDDLVVETDDEALEVTSEQVDVVVASPDEVGDRWFCPNRFPIRAYDEGRYYPPHHPGGPGLDVPPEQCFADDEGALAAGYRLAPPPSGGRLAGDIYLVPVQQPRQDECRRLADAIGLTVPCPTLLPTPGVARPCVAGRCHGGVLIEQRGFAVPDGWCEGGDLRLPGAGPGDVPGCRLWITIGAIEGTPKPAQLVCGAGSPAPHRGRWEGLAPRPGLEVFTCPDNAVGPPGTGDSPHLRGVVTVWRRDGVTYAASLRGPTSPEAVAVLTALARAVEYVEPA